MSVTSKLKRGVDLPMWEWLRPLPQVTATATPSNFVTAGRSEGRYIYYLPANAGFRYDTWNDGWTTIATPPFSQTTVASSRYNDYHGYSGRMISGSSNGFRAAVPKGNKCVGKKVRIVSGTGVGQERTITNVSDPTIWDTMITTTASAQSMIDSNKTTYTLNQWRDYGLRIVTNSSSDFRKIIHNNTSGTVTFADNTFTSVGLPWSYSPLTAATLSSDGGETRAQIESYDITVDSNWTTIPDNTSVFVIQSGMIWNVNSFSSRFSIQSYDVLNDSWYQNTSVGAGILNTNLATDVALESLNESSVGVLLNSTVSSASSNAITLSASMTNNQYANYIIRVVSGTGAGQDRLIVSSSGSTININRKWDAVPDNTSVVKIVADNNKIYMTNGGNGALLEYDAFNDVWSDRRILEVGCPSSLCAIWTGFKRPVALSGITRSGTVATATTTNAAHGLKVGDTITIAGANDSVFNVTTTIIATPAANTFTYAVANTGGTTAVASAAQSSTQLVDASKSWTVNEHVGKIITFTTTAFSTTGGFNPVYNHKVITSNTATTLVFATGAIPTSGTTVYMITDAKSLGGIFQSTVGAGATTTNIPVSTTITDGVGVYAALRAIIIDGQNWVEFIISNNTATSITPTSAIGFAPTASAVITVLGVAGTGAGTSLEHLYNTSTKQKGRYMFATRGGTTNYMYLYDITTSTWDVLSQTPNSETFSSGTFSSYDGDDRVYIQRDATGRVLYYDLTDNNVYSYNQVPFGMGNATLGNKMSILKTEDGLKFIYIPRHSSNEFWRSLLWI
jgi:hypothetical protein